MVLATHILIGAAIGAKTNNLGLIIFLGILTHLILDIIPHWDYIKTVHEKNNYKIFKKNLINISIDIIIGLIILFLILYFSGFITKSFDLNRLLLILIGAFFSTLPDILLAIAHLLPKFKIAEKYILFHENLHWHRKSRGQITFLGIANPVVVIIISFIILLNF